MKIGLDWVCPLRRSISGRSPVRFGPARARSSARIGAASIFASLPSAAALFAWASVSATTRGLTAWLAPKYGKPRSQNTTTVGSGVNDLLEITGDDVAQAGVLRALVDEAVDPAAYDAIVIGASIRYGPKDRPQPWVTIVGVVADVRDRGVYLPPSAFESAFLCAAHGDSEIDRTLEAADAARAVQNRQRRGVQIRRDDFLIALASEKVRAVGCGVRL